jgi:hypothetical protein
MNRKIINPLWINNARTTLECFFEFDNGVRVRATIGTTLPNGAENPDYVAVLEQYSLTDIEQNTQRRMAEMKRARELSEEKQKEAVVRRETEELYFVKHEIFAIPEIKASKDKQMKARIRRAKSKAEAQALAAVFIMKELGDGNKGKEEVAE